MGSDNGKGDRDGCLRSFAADQPGPVLMFAAEDAGHIVRTRLQGIARAAGADCGATNKMRLGRQSG